MIDVTLSAQDFLKELQPKQFKQVTGKIWHRQGNHILRIASISPDTLGAKTRNRIITTPNIICMNAERLATGHRRCLALIEKSCNFLRSR